MRVPYKFSYICLFMLGEKGPMGFQGPQGIKGSEGTKGTQGLTGVYHDVKSFETMYGTVSILHVTTGPSS